MYRVSDTVRSTHNQDGAIVLDIKQGVMLRLNVTAGLIFERLQQGKTQSQIVDTISQEFGISHEIAEVDVSEFLKSLEQHRLVDNQLSDSPR
jgi:hypothetical protein